MPAVPPPEAVALLEGRVRRLGTMAEEIRAGIEITTKRVERFLLVEWDYRLAMVEAERQFVEDLLARIAEDEAYTRIWKGFHADPGRGASEPGPDPS